MSFLTRACRPSTAQRLVKSPVLNRLRRCWWWDSPFLPLSSSTSSPLLTRSMVVVTQTQSSSSSQPTNNNNNNKTTAPTNTEENQNESSLLIITDNCWQRLNYLTQKKNENKDSYLRVYVDAGGCSGFTYKFELEQNDIDPQDDTIFEGPNGQRVVVDESSLELIQGSTLDYVQEMIKSAFEVKNNPQSESACGCGSSFAVKNFSANPALD